MALNPMSFVTPYTAVGSGGRGGGASLANSMQGARSAKTQEGYLANQQRQQAFSEQKYGQKEMDEARERLDAALMSGNQDAVELAANNLRAVASRNGFSLTETRSDAQLKSGVSTAVGEQKAVGSAGKLAPGEVGSEETPLDLDAYEAEQRQAKGKYTPGEEAASNARINAELEPSPFTGMRPPGGSLPAAPGKASAPAIRTPGGSLPAASAAEPPGASEAPLRGYTITGPDGKPIYSVAPKDVEGRQRQRVTGIFQELRAKTKDPQEHQWLGEAEAIAGKLVGVTTLEKAAQVGLEHFTSRVNGANKLAMVEANRKPRWGGGGGATGGYATGKDGQAQRAMTDDAWTAVQNTMGNFDIKGLNKTDNGLANAQTGLNSTNPASQRGAIRNILKAMSGLTVNAKEEAGYERLAGLAEQASNMLRQLTGDEMSPEYIAAVKQMLSEWRSESARIRSDAGRRAADAYMGFSPQAPPEVIQEQADTIFRYFVGGSAGGSKPKYRTPDERAKETGNDAEKRARELAE